MKKIILIIGLFAAISFGFPTDITANPPDTTQKQITTPQPSPQNNTQVQSRTTNWSKIKDLFM